MNNVVFEKRRSNKVDLTAGSAARFLEELMVRPADGLWGDAAACSLITILNLDVGRM